jgi:hypothetical protein
MRTTYSKPDVKWDGFRPVVYSLSELALRLPLTQTRRDGDQQLEDDTSIEKLLESLEGRDFQVEDETVAIRITSEMGSLRLKGPTFNCRLASAILELFKNGIKPFASRWFWYDTDESDTDPQTRYKFFVVHEDRIVRESVSFSDYSGSGFDPTVFDSGDGSDDSNWDLAWAAYWYRRFYRETLIGQLMVLRPRFAGDSPLPGGSVLAQTDRARRKHRPPEANPLSPLGCNCTVGVSCILAHSEMIQREMRS